MKGLGETIVVGSSKLNGSDHLRYHGPGTGQGWSIPGGFPMTHKQLSFVWLVVFVLIASVAHGSDWPRFRGINGDGTSSETGLFTKDGDVGLNVAWKTSLGSGYSGIAVANGTLVTMYADGESDYIASYNLETGDQSWRYEMGASYAGHDGSHTGPLSTPLIDGDTVFGLSGQGRLFALALKTGKVKWATELVADHKSRPPFYGYSTSPLLQDGVLVVQVGAEEAAVAGFNPDSGEVLWSVAGGAVMHQSPIPFKLNGRSQVVVADNTNMRGINPSDGEVLWEYDHEGSGPQGVWSLMPVPAGDGRLFLTHKDESASMVSLKVTDEIVVADKLWEEGAIKGSYNIPIYHDGYLYGFSRRILNCVNAETGELVWRSREPGDGFMVLVDGHLVIVTKKGSLHIIAASSDGYTELASLPLFEDLTWTEASIADGSLYIRSLGELVRVDITGSQEGMAGVRKKMPLGPKFSSFLEAVAAAPADEKNKLIDAFLAKQSQFPIVEGDIVQFIYRGDGNDLAVGGDMIGARQERHMQRLEGTDLLYYGFKLAPDGRFNYLYMRDYEAIRDPLNTRETKSYVVTPEMEMNQGGEATEMSWFSMPEWKAPAHLEEPAADRRGTIESHSLESEALGASHKIDVYLPVGYADSDTNYPVAYINGGAAAMEVGQWPRALDNLIGNGVQPIIAVFIHNNPPMFGSPAPHAQMVLGELVPFIDSTYRTVAEGQGRAIIGNGGLTFPTFLSVLMQPGMFSKVASQSGVIFDFAKVTLAPMMKTADELPLDIYIDWGAYDLRSEDESWDMADSAKDLVELLRKQGYSPAGGEAADGTGWSSWRNRTDALLTTLFPSGS